MKRISFTTAQLAMKKGYDEDCGSAYDIYGNIINTDNYNLDIIPEYSCQAPYQSEIQDWLRDECGMVLLVYLDQSLSYYWTITNLDTGAVVTEHSEPKKVLCYKYQDCLEKGLRVALRLL